MGRRCGTGNYTAAFAKTGHRFTAVDPSEKMLAEARATTAEVDWLRGHAEDLGLLSDTFDGVLATLTIHHWSDLEEGFTEVARVATPGARVVVFTSTPEQMCGYWLNHYFPKMMQASMGQMPTLADVRTAMAAAGIELEQTLAFDVQPDLQDGFLYSGKHDPARYLDARVRRGISSFAALADAGEVAAGLAALRRDLDSGAIRFVRDQYANAGGDYLFTVGRKGHS